MMGKKYYIIIIATLVVLNIFSWRIWWENPRNKSIVLHGIEEKATGRRGGMGFFANKLNLNEEQKKEFEQLRKSYFKSIESVKDSLNAVRIDMMSNLDDEMDFSTQEERLTEMASYKLRMEKLTLNHFKDLRKVCNQDQKLVYDTLIVHLMKHHPMFKNEGRKQGKNRRGHNRR